jgi:hypothetical protein
VNALDRRHPSQRRYYRNVRIAMTLAALTHAAVFAWVSGSAWRDAAAPRPSAHGRGGVGAASRSNREGSAAAVAPRSNVPSTYVESFRAVDPAVRTIAAAEEEAIAPRSGAIPTGTSGSGGSGSDGAAGYGSTTDGEAEVFLRVRHPSAHEAPRHAGVPGRGTCRGLEGTVVVNVNHRRSWPDPARVGRAVERGRRSRQRGSRRGLPVRVRAGEVARRAGAVHGRDPVPVSPEADDPDGGTLKPWTSETSESL